jgi:Spy/CpxP family protein refolding chaperone
MKSLKLFFPGLLAALCVASPALIAQGPQQFGHQFGPERPPMERSAGPRGEHFAWWRNPEMVKKIGLTDDQVKKMDDIFQQNRLTLVDIEANLRKEEIKLQPLVDADSPDEAAVVAQIDRIAQARAELEKTNARFLLGIRKQLTPEQWQKLKAEQARRFQHPRGPEGRQRGGHQGQPDAEVQPEAPGPLAPPTGF